MMIAAAPASGGGGVMWSKWKEVGEDGAKNIIERFLYANYYSMPTLGSLITLNILVMGTFWYFGVVFVVVWNFCLL